MARGLFCLTLGLLLVAGQAKDAKDSKDSWRGFATSCAADDARNISVSCQGVRIVRRVLEQILEDSRKEPDIEIFDGVSLVEVQGGGSPRRARFLKGYGAFGPFLQFLEGRELRVKLPSLLPDNIETAFKDSLPSAAQGRKGSGGGFGGGGGYGGGGGGGGKKGGGGLMLVALMMGKMMAALGFGALGMLTMKALMVSAMALMLSMIVAVKKLASGHDDGGGHHVVYAQEVGGHHHRKRSLGDDEDELALPYRGYVDLYGTMAS